MDESLMNISKSAIDNSVKFGFGSSYKKKVVKLTVSQIVKSKGKKGGCSSDVKEI